MKFKQFQYLSQHIKVNDQWINKNIEFTIWKETSDLISLKKNNNNKNIDAQQKLQLQISLETFKQPKKEKQMNNNNNK